jgi:hypothetical protein
VCVCVCVCFYSLPPATMASCALRRRAREVSAWSMHAPFFCVDASCMQAIAVSADLTGPFSGSVTLPMTLADATTNDLVSALGPLCSLPVFAAGFLACAQAVG